MLSWLFRSNSGLLMFPLIRSDISLDLLPVTHLLPVFISETLLWPVQPDSGCNFHLFCPSGTFGCGSNETSSSSFYSVAMVSVPNCVDSATQTDITFQNIVAVGKSRRRHHHHHPHHQGRDPSPPPPSPIPPHLMAPNGLDELYVLTCFG